MKIQTHQLTSTPKIVTFSDSDAWVEELIHSISDYIEGNDLSLKGSVTLIASGESGVLVSGQISWAPKLPCGRCNLALPQNLSQNFDVFYQPPPPKSPKLVDLEERDLDEYSLDEAGEFDLSELLRERLLLSLPDIASPPLAEGGSCSVCKKSFSDDGLVYGQKDDEEDHPFSSLRNMKLKN